MDAPELALDASAVAMLVDSHNYAERVSIAAKLARRHAMNPALPAVVETLLQHQPIPAIQLSEEVVMPEQSTSTSIAYATHQLGLVMASASGLRGPVENSLQSPSMYFKRLTAKETVRMATSDSELLNLIHNSVASTRMRLLSNCVRLRRVDVLNACVVQLETSHAEQAAQVLHGCSSDVVAACLRGLFHNKRLSWVKLARFHGEVLVAMLREDVTAASMADRENVWKKWTAVLQSQGMPAVELLLAGDVTARARKLLEIIAQYPILTASEGSVEEYQVPELFNTFAWRFFALVPDEILKYLCKNTIRIVNGKLHASVLKGIISYVSYPYDHYDACEESARNYKKPQSKTLSFKHRCVLLRHLCDVMTPEVLYTEEWPNATIFNSAATPLLSALRYCHLHESLTLLDIYMQFVSRMTVPSESMSQTVPRHRRTSIRVAWEQVWRQLCEAIDLVVRKIQVMERTVKQSPDDVKAKDMALLRRAHDVVGNIVMGHLIDVICLTGPHAPMIHGFEDEHGREPMRTSPVTLLENILSYSLEDSFTLTSNALAVLFDRLQKHLDPQAWAHEHGSVSQAGSRDYVRRLYILLLKSAAGGRDRWDVHLEEERQLLADRIVAHCWDTIMGPLLGRRPSKPAGLYATTEDEVLASVACLGLDSLSSPLLLHASPALRLSLFESMTDEELARLSSPGALAVYSSMGVVLKASTLHTTLQSSLQKMVERFAPRECRSRIAAVLMQLPQWAEPTSTSALLDIQDAKVRKMLQKGAVGVDKQQYTRNLAVLMQATLASRRVQEVSKTLKFLTDRAHNAVAELRVAIAKAVTSSTIRQDLVTVCVPHSRDPTIPPGAVDMSSELAALWLQLARDSVEAPDAVDYHEYWPAFSYDYDYSQQPTKYIIAQNVQSVALSHASRVVKVSHGEWRHGLWVQLLLDVEWVIHTHHEGRNTEAMREFVATRLLPRHDSQGRWFKYKGPEREQKLKTRTSVGPTPSQQLADDRQHRLATDLVQATRKYYQSRSADRAVDISADPFDALRVKDILSVLGDRWLDVPLLVEVVEAYHTLWRAYAVQDVANGWVLLETDCMLDPGSESNKRSRTAEGNASDSMSDSESGQDSPLADARKDAQRCFDVLQLLLKMHSPPVRSRMTLLHPLQNYREDAVKLRPWYQITVLVKFVSSLLETRHAPKVVLRWLRNCIEQGEGPQRPRKAAAIAELLRLSPSAIHIDCVWRFLLRYDQPRLTSNLMAPSEPIVGVFYCDRPRGKQTSFISNEARAAPLRFRKGALHVFLLPERRHGELRKLAPAQCRLLTAKLVTEVEDNALAAQSRVFSAKHLARVPITTAQDLVHLLQAHGALLTEPSSTVVSWENAQEEKRSSPFPVDVVCALLSGLMRAADELFPPLALVACHPLLLTADLAIVAAYTFARAVGKLPDEQILELLETVAKPGRKRAVQTFKEIFRVVSKMEPSERQRALYRTEWGNRHPHPDVQVAIVQSVAASWATHRSEEGWTLLLSMTAQMLHVNVEGGAAAVEARREFKPTVVASLLAVQPEVDNVGLKQESPRLVPSVGPQDLREVVGKFNSLKAVHLPIDLCKQYLDNVVAPCCRQDEQLPVKYVAYSTLSRWVDACPQGSGAGGLITNLCTSMLCDTSAGFLLTRSQEARACNDMLVEASIGTLLYACGVVSAGRKPKNTTERSLDGASYRDVAVVLASLCSHLQADDEEGSQHNLRVAVVKRIESIVAALKEAPGRYEIPGRAITERLHQNSVMLEPLSSCGRLFLLCMPTVQSEWLVALLHQSQQRQGAARLAVAEDVLKSLLGVAAEAFVRDAGSSESRDLFNLFKRLLSNMHAGEAKQLVSSLLSLAFSSRAAVGSSVGMLKFFMKLLMDSPHRKVPHEAWETLLVAGHRLCQELYAVNHPQVGSLMQALASCLQHILNLEDQSSSSTRLASELLRTWLSDAFDPGNISTALTFKHNLALVVLRNAPELLAEAIPSKLPAVISLFVMANLRALEVSIFNPLSQLTDIETIPMALKYLHVKQAPELRKKHKAGSSLETLTAQALSVPAVVAEAVAQLFSGPRGDIATQPACCAWLFHMRASVLRSFRTYMISDNALRVIALRCLLEAVNAHRPIETAATSMVVDALSSALKPTSDVSISITSATYFLEALIVKADVERTDDGSSVDHEANGLSNRYGEACASIAFEVLADLAGHFAVEDAQHQRVWPSAFQCILQRLSKQQRYPAVSSAAIRTSTICGGQVI